MINPQILTIIFFLSLSLTFAQKCQILALQAGGDRGSYESGALWTMVHNSTDPSTTQYDVITGVSIGAINTALLSQYPKGQEQDMVDNLLRLWSNLTVSDVYNTRPKSVADSLLSEPSVYDTTPGKEFLQAQITNTSQRMVAIGACNAETGQFTVFNESLSLEDLIQAVLCSAAMPGVFPSQVFQNNTYVDGSVIQDLNIQSGVERCREKGFNDSDIVVDVVMTQSQMIAYKNVTGINGFEMFVRGGDITGYWFSVAELRMALEGMPMVEYRYLVMPSQQLPGSSLFPVKFNQSEMEFMINLGKQDALSVIQEGSGVAFKKVLNVF